MASPSNQNNNNNTKPSVDEKTKDVTEALLLVTKPAQSAHEAANNMMIARQLA